MGALTNRVRQLVIKQAASKRNLSTEELIEHLGSDIEPPTQEREHAFMVENFCEELGDYPKQIAKQV
jgi:hypothetical protein